MPAPNDDIVSNAILSQLDGAVCRQRTKTEYYDDSTSTWTEFDPKDIESRSIQTSTNNDRYQVTSFLPPSRKMSLTLNNFNQQYNTGAGDPKSDILKKNLLIRAWSGYDLTFIATMGSFNDDFTTRTKFVHTNLVSGCVVPDVTDFTGSYDTAAFVNVYDSNTYDTNTYTGLGYYKKTLTLPSLSSKQKATKLVLHTSTNRHNFKYKASPYSDFFGADWSTFSSIATGANTKTLDADYDTNYIQYLLTYEGSTFTDAFSLCTATLFYEDKTWLKKQGVYIIDDPKLGEKATITGRDYLRKALETEINMPPFTANTSITTLFSKVLDRCNIPYDTSDWDATSTTASITSGDHSGLNNISGYKMMDLLMDYINAGDDNWQFQFTDNGKAVLKNVPSREEVDFVVNANVNILGNATKSTDSDKQIQRITMLNKNITVNAESTLATYTSTSTASLYATYAQALYVRYEDDNDIILTESYRSNTAVRFTTKVSKPYTIRIMGCTPKNAITDEVYAVRGNSNNIIANDGTTYKNTNALFNQDACNEYCDYVINTFGDPQKTVNYKQWSNPFMELNDNVSFFDKDTSSNSIFNITSINESWTPPALNETVKLQDTGTLLTNMVWDRNGMSKGLNDLRMDTGVVWDMDRQFSDTSATYVEIKNKVFT
jgi:hypothetical protein